MFKSVDSALKWATHISTLSIIDSPCLANHIPDHDRSPFRNDLLVNLSQAEIHAQSAQIIRMVESLDDPAFSEYMLAKYRMIDKLDTLIYRVASGFGGTINRRSLQNIILEYCGRKKFSTNDYKDMFGCGKSQAYRNRSVVYERMDKIHYQAMDALESKMAGAGLVLRNNC